MFGTPTPRSLKQRLRAGDSITGTFVQIAAPALVEILGAAGFDFAIVDTEHGPIGRDSMAASVRAAQGAGLGALVRTPVEEIGQCLDAGADGILVPRITSIDLAREAVAAARYAPEGTRGACIGVRAQRYNTMPWTTYATAANANTLVALALEGPSTLALAPEIMALEGVDVLFVGAFDLSQSLGFPGQPMHPAVTEALGTIVANAARYQCAVGTWTPTAADGRVRRQAGVRFLTVGTDALIFSHAAATLIQDLRHSYSQYE
jgi:4-hydroxy-2-oxoheptanedioate aldolase